MFLENIFYNQTLKAIIRFIQLHVLHWHFFQVRTSVFANLNAHTPRLSTWPSTPGPRDFVDRSIRFHSDSSSLYHEYINNHSIKNTQVWRERAPHDRLVLFPMFMICLENYYTSIMHVLMTQYLNVWAKPSWNKLFYYYVSCYWCYITPSHLGYNQYGNILKKHAMIRA